MRGQVDMAPNNWLSGLYVLIITYNIDISLINRFTGLSVCVRLFVRPSVRLSVCPSVRLSVRPSITLLFRCLWDFLPHFSCTNAPLTSSMAPAHPHATGVAVYPALFLVFPIPNVTLWQTPVKCGFLLKKNIF